MKDRRPRNPEEENRERRDTPPPERERHTREPELPEKPTPEERLDEALEETFPASDPPSIP